MRQIKKILWAEAAKWLRRGWQIEKLYSVEGEMWVELSRMSLEGSVVAQDGSNG